MMMKKALTVLMVFGSMIAAAQPKKAPKMAPITELGYYVGNKNDTVRGEVQTNPEDETEIYRSFNFKPAKGGKLMPVSGKKAKSYGFGDRHFTQIMDGDKPLYLERLVTGRINFFEYKEHGKIDGNPAIVSTYYVQDTRAEGSDAGLKEINKISSKFYKRDLKPYLKDQPMIWNDLDKFNLDLNALKKSLNEFNSYYVIKNSDDEE